VSDEMVDDAGGYEAPDSLPDSLADPLRSQ
jgi:hypothetical protein